MFLSKYRLLIALDTVFRRKRDWLPRDWFLSPNFSETHFKVKIAITVFFRARRSTASCVEEGLQPTLSKSRINLYQTVSFGNGLEPHGISSQARISPSPVLIENGSSELPRALLSTAEFVKRTLEPVSSYTHLERGFIVKWIWNCPKLEFRTYASLKPMQCIPHPWIPWNPF